MILFLRTPITLVFLEALILIRLVILIFLKMGRILRVIFIGMWQLQDLMMRFNPSP
jgi:hypothetical protein